MTDKPTVKIESMQHPKVNGKPLVAVIMINGMNGFQISSHGRSPSIKRTQRLSHGQAPPLPLVWWI